MTDATSGGSAQLGAIHSLSGTQWVLGDQPLWPDAEIVVPFERRVTDATGKVSGDPVPARVEAGYLVTDTLTQLELHDLVRDVDIDPIGAVWGASPSGTTARLQILAGNPFAWLTESSVASQAHETPSSMMEQRFGIGPDRDVTGSTRFGDVVIEVADAARLISVWTPPLATLVLDTASFKIAFSDGNGSPFTVDSVGLVVVGAPKIAESIKGVTSIQRLPSDDAELWLATLEIPGPVSALDVSVGRLLLWAVRYRIAASAFTSPGRTLLQPSKYLLSLAGRSTAIAPQLAPPNDSAPIVPDAHPVTWQVSQEFEVITPPSLRPYLRRTSVGDSRLFSADASWNPTPHGIGFPAYRGHRLALRFASPDVHTIFGDLQVSVTDAHDGSPILQANGTAAANPEAESTSTAEAIAWAAAHGTGIAPDDELILPAAFPDGPANEAVAVQISAYGATVDSWQTALSGFADLTAHLTTTDTSITACFDAAGPHQLDQITQFYAVPITLGGHLLPPDWTTPPPGWGLPDELAASIGAPAPKTYLSFAAATAARFHDPTLAGGALPLLTGVTTVAARTHVDAVCDADGRPLTLWLRTPEPVDWRRVTAAARIWHVSPDAGPPTALVHRSPLNLEITILPSPDATSAFLVGTLGGTPIRFPRGVVELHLEAQLRSGTLPVLRRADGALVESQTIRLVMPSGLPLPPFVG